MREFRLDVAGVQLFAVEAGTGPAIVLLHGGMANHLAVMPLLAQLSVRYRVIAPDQRGSGKSVSAAPLDFDRLADDVVALLGPSRVADRGHRRRVERFRGGVALRIAPPGAHRPPGHGVAGLRRRKSWVIRNSSGRLSG